MVKKEKAKVILAEVDSLFHAAEKQSPDGNVTYLDVVRICDRVREHFSQEMPEEIEGYLYIAQGLVHPDKIEGIKLMKDGIGAFTSLTGGFSIMLGVVYILAFGTYATVTTGYLWWKATVTTIFFGGPIALVIGVASLAAGLYLLGRNIPIKQQIGKSLELIRKGVNDWAEKQDIDLGNLMWLKNLSEEEFEALVFLFWQLVNADDKYAQEEALFIEHIFKVRLPKDGELIQGIRRMDFDKSVETIQKSRYKEESLKLLEMIPSIDNEVDDRESSLLRTILNKLS